MTRRVGAVVLLAGLVLFGAAGCIGDDDPVTAPGVLQPADVATGRGPVVSRTSYCGDIAKAEARALRFAGDAYTVRELAAADGVTVESAVYDVKRADARLLLFGQGFARGVQTCGAFFTNTLTGTFSPLTDLPADAVGYSLVIEGGAPRVQQRAYAMVGSYVVVVGARRDGNEPLDVPIADLIAKAVSKVEQARAGDDQPA